MLLVIFAVPFGIDITYLNAVSEAGRVARETATEPAIVWNWFNAGLMLINSAAYAVVITKLIKSWRA